MAEDGNLYKNHSDEELVLSEEEKAYIKKMLERFMELGYPGPFLFVTPTKCED